MRRPVIAIGLSVVLLSSAASAQHRAPGLPAAPGLPHQQADFEEEPYEEGMPVPPGHHLIKHARPGLIAGGITMVVLGIVAGGVAAAIFASESSGCADHEAACTAGGIAVSVVAAGLGIGGGLMIQAGAAPKTYLVPDGYAKLKPSSPGGMAFRLVGTF